MINILNSIILYILICMVSITSLHAQDSLATQKFEIDTTYTNRWVESGHELKIDYFKINQTDHPIVVDWSDQECLPAIMIGTFIIEHEATGCLLGGSYKTELLPNDTLEMNL